MRRAIVLGALLVGCAKSEPPRSGKDEANGKATISPNYVPFMPPADPGNRSR